MSGLFRKVSRRAKITGLCGWAERIRTREWRTRVEPRSFRRRDRDRNVTEKPFCAPPVPGTVSDTAHLMSESADGCAPGSAPGHDKKPHINSYLGCLILSASEVRTLKNLLGLAHFRSALRPLPRGRLRRTRRPNYDLTERDWSRDDVLPFAKPNNNNSSGHPTLISLR
jgi:hypothetical protein